MRLFEHPDFEQAVIRAAEHFHPLGLREAIIFALHPLGWKAFQDLCVTILKAILGQTVPHFFDSRDGGRDGTFSGVWRQKAK